MTEHENSFKRAFVIGHPIAHSRSPALHGHWLARYAIVGRYDAINVAPKSLRTFVATMRDAGFEGGNVTLPHKESVVALVDEEDTAATRIGAINTLWFDKGRLVGGNTDGQGFIANLDQSAPCWDHDHQNATAVILGAGGAARAVLVALAERGIGRMVVLNRSAERAETICRHCGTVFPHVVFEPLPWEERASALSNAQLLVNTTSLGMAGQPTLNLPLDSLPSDTVVNDLVYKPLQTDLLARASARGNIVVDGLGMLLHQAVPGFARWFGVTPVVDAALRKAVLEA